MGIFGNYDSSLPLRMSVVCCPLLIRSMRWNFAADRKMVGWCRDWSKYVSAIDEAEEHAGWSSRYGFAATGCDPGLVVVDEGVDAFGANQFR